MKQIVAPLALLAACASATVLRAQAGPLVVELTDRDDGRSVSAPVGSELSVHLRQQAGTAYTWEMRRDDTHVALIGAPKTIDYTHQSGVVGFRQDRVFRVKVISAGRFPLIFGLRTGTGGNEQAPARRIIYTVDTKPGQ